MRRFARVRDEVHGRCGKCLSEHRPDPTLVKVDWSGGAPAIYLPKQYGRAAFLRPNREYTAVMELYEDLAAGEVRTKGLPPDSASALRKLDEIEMARARAEVTGRASGVVSAAVEAPRTIFFKAERKSGYELRCPEGRCRHRPRVKAATLIRMAERARESGTTVFYV